MHYAKDVRLGFAAKVQEFLRGQLAGHWDGKGPSGDWYSIRCPLHDDSSASCSLSASSGDLNCHGGCGKVKLFDWWAKFQSLEGWREAVDSIATILGIEEPEKGLGRPKTKFIRVSDSLIRELATNLWSLKENGPIRRELESRGFREKHLEQYEIGAVHSDRGVTSLLFPYFDRNGEVLNRAKIWCPTGSPRWRWDGDKDIGCIGLWPCFPPKDPDSDILITEGEWDALAVREIVRWPVETYAWNGGAGQHPRAHQLPDWIEGRKVFLCFDLDVWQGPDVDASYVPADKQKSLFIQRRNSFLEFARILESVGSEVWLLQVPLDPKEHPSGDLRDYISISDAPNFDDLKAIPLSESNKGPKVLQLDSLHWITSNVDKTVGLKCRASGFASDDFLPAIGTTLIQCNQDQGDMCKKCPVSADKGIADWSSRAKRMELDRLIATQHLTKINASRGIDMRIAHEILNVPFSCKSHKVLHIPSKSGEKTDVWWLSDREGGDGAQDVLAVMRRGEGRLQAGDNLSVVAVPGMAVGEPIMFLSVDKYEVDGSAVFKMSEAEASELDMLSPDNTSSKKVEEHVTSMVLDLINNVTHVYGPDAASMHLTLMMAFASSLWLRTHNTLIRGWGDVAIIGPPGSGKTQIASSLFKHFGGHGASTSTSPANWSAAGICIGYEQRNNLAKAYKAKPGLFPMNHGKMAIFDEFHSVSSTDWEADGFMAQLQSARSDGVMNSMKIGGHKKLQSAVRFVTISNPKADAHDYRCRELMRLYRKPEQIRRLDSALWVDLYTGPAYEDKAPHVWTSSRCERLMLRAWSIDPDDIKFEEDANWEIERIVAGWQSTYGHAIDQLPLFSGKDKINSLRRMAVSVANLCFSHPESDPNKCLVTSAHVMLAADWFESTWSSIEYDEFARFCASSAVLSRQTECEYLLLKWAVPPAVDGMTVIFDPLEVTDTLNQIGSHGVITKDRAATIIGSRCGPGINLQTEVADWLGRGEKNNMWTWDTSSKGHHSVSLTDSGRKLLEEIRKWCSYPELYKNRVQEIILNQGQMPDGYQELSVWSAENWNIRKR